MVERFNIDDLRMDKLERAQFKEFLQFMINREKEFSYNDFKRHTGISRQQWDVFRNTNQETGVKWIIE